MIGELMELVGKGGAALALFTLAWGVLIAGLVFVAQSTAAWFDGRNP